MSQTSSAFIFNNVDIIYCQNVRFRSCPNDRSRILQVQFLGCFPDPVRSTNNSGWWFPLVLKYVKATTTDSLSGSRSLNQTHSTDSLSSSPSANHTQPIQLSRAQPTTLNRFTERLSEPTTLNRFTERFSIPQPTTLNRFTEHLSLSQPHSTVSLSISPSPTHTQPIH